MILIVRIFLFNMLIILSCTGCNKDKYYTSVSGKVINNGSKEPIKGAMVILQDGIETTDVISQELDVETASGLENISYTDVNGEFFVELQGEHRPFLVVVKDSFHQTESSIHGSLADGELMPLSKKTYQDVVLELNAQAYFAGVLFSENTAKSDVINFELYTIGGGEYFGTYHLREYEGEGPFHPYTGDYSTHFGGDKFFFYYLELEKNGVKTETIDSIYMTSLEIYTDTIFY